MKRAVPVVLATLGGLALLANFHTAAVGSPRAAASVGSTTTTAAGSGPPPSGTDPASTSTTAGTGAVRQVDGAVIPTQFGDVQVRVFLNGTRITDVQPLQMPFSHRRSEEISQQAAPLLHDEVLQAQSAQINLLSGATYTSDAYQRSLQAALDQVK